MKDTKEALELRNALKRKKPNFLRQDAHKKAKLDNNWRRPRGRHSKMRFGLASYRKKPATGYGSPKLVKGLNSEGLKEVHVYNLEDLKNVQKNEGIVIGKTVGLKKKITILKKIKELKDLIILNVKNLDKFIKEAEEKLQAKKKVSEEREKEKKKSKEESVKKAEDKKKEEEKKTEEEKKKKEEDKAQKEARQKSMQKPV